MAESNAVFKTPAVEEVSEERELEFECSESSKLELVAEPEFPLTAKLSSLLFVSTRPLSAQALSKAARCSEDAVLEALEAVAKNFSDEIHGFSLCEVGGNWEFRSAPEAKNAIHRLIPPKARRLSKAAAESLAVVAYKQPVQRAEIEAIRGVDALPTIKTLLDARLIRIVGRESSPGHPALYGTTQTFLEKFGLQDLSQLPTPAELEALLEDPGEPSSGDDPGEPSSKADSEEVSAMEAKDEELSAQSESTQEESLEDDLPQQDSA